jgi:uncharacterized protein YcbX
MEPDPARRVARISIAPVKAFRLLHPERVVLSERGVAENRRFVIVGADGRHLRSEPTAWPALISGAYDADRERLAMTFPDGTEVEGSALELGDSVVTHIEPGPRRMEMRIVEGPWNEHLSRVAGRAVRLARPERPGDPLSEPVTLMSDGSLERLAREAGGPVDPRRFRMLFTLSGCEAHEEDTWEGRLVRLGEAVIRVTGPVDRCVVTTRHPDTAQRDLDTLRLIKGYRGMRGRFIDFGMFAQVATPGTVAVGDPVEVLGPADCEGDPA